MYYYRYYSGLGLSHFFICKDNDVGFCLTCSAKSNIKKCYGVDIPLTSLDPILEFASKHQEQLKFNADKLKKVIEYLLTSEAKDGS